MKFTRYALITFMVLSLILFGVNIMGKNVFLDIAVSDQTYVIGASQGVCHLAVTTESIDVNPLGDEYEGLNLIEDIGYKEILQIGPFGVSIENRLEPLSLLRYDYSRGDELFDYSALEFPWLLIPCVLVGLLFVIKKKTKQTE